MHITGFNTDDKNKFHSDITKHICVWNNKFVMDIFMIWFYCYL